MPCAQREGQALLDELNAAGDALVMQAPDGLQLGPHGGNVDGDQRGAIQTLCGFPAIQDQIALQRPRGDAGPLAPGAQGHAGADTVQRRGEAPGLAPAATAEGAQQPVERSGAGGREGRPDRRRDVHTMVGLQGGQQRGENRDQ